MLINLLPKYSQQRGTAFLWSLEITNMCDFFKKTNLPAHFNDPDGTINSKIIKPLETT